MGVAPETSVCLPGDKPGPRDCAARLLERAPQRFLICGFSLGGIVALQATLLAPERVAGVVLISTTGRADDPARAPARRQQVAVALEQGPAALVEAELWPNYVARAHLGAEVLKARVVAMADAVGAARFANQVEIAIARPDVLSELGALRLPLLQINGAEDPTTTPALGAEIVAQVTGATHAVIAGAGHFVLMEQPAETAGAIMEWFGRTGPA